MTPEIIAIVTVGVALAGGAPLPTLAPGPRLS